MPPEADARLRDLIATRLRGADARPIGPHLRKAAAVAVAVCEAGHGGAVAGLPSHSSWQTHAALLLTRRSAQLRLHAGQWALPGGRIDAGETPEAAALRELAEEVDLVLDADAVLGRLDDYETRSGFVITPVVVWAGTARGLRANPAEVASIHRIPTDELRRADSPRLEPGPDAARPVLRMPVGDDWIAAPTAAVLYQFREWCLEGRPTRVAHFDQPAFAWR